VSARAALPLAAVAGLALGELVLAGALATGRLTSLLIAIAALLGLALVASFPMAAAGALMIATASVFHGNWLNVGIGPITAAPYELLLAGLLFVALARPRRAVWGGASGAALAAFLLLTGVAGVLAVSEGRVELSTAFEWSRGFVFFTFFWVVIRLFPEPERRRKLLAVACAVGAMTGVMALLVSLDAGLGELLQDRTGQFIRSQEGLGLLQRVRFPGLSLAYAVFWYAAVRAFEARGPGRSLWVLTLTGLALSIALSFNRNMWLGLALGMVVVLAFGGVAMRRRLSLALAGLAVVAAVLAISGASVEERSTLSPLAQRGASLLDPQALAAEDSLRAREDENARAWSVASDNLTIGIGAGTEFGVFFNESRPGGRFVRTPQLFLHNQYLYLLLIAGVPALAAFLIFVLGGLRGALWMRPRSPGLAACGAGMAMIAVSAFVAIYFTAEDMILGLTLLAGHVVASRTPAESGYRDPPAVAAGEGAAGVDASPTTM
jgi:O-antigen ligase